MTKIVGFLLVLMLVLLLASSLMSDQGDGSTFSSKPGGAKAMLELLQAEGVESSLLLKPLSSIIDDDAAVDTTLLILEPREALLLRDLESWVAKGNTLVAAGSFTIPQVEFRGSGDDSFSLEKTLSSIPYLDSENESERFLSPQGSFRGLTLVSKPRYVFDSVDEGFEVLATDSKGKAYIVKRIIGQGEIILFSDSSYFLNQNIDLFDNLELIYQLLTDRGSVLIDEFHHGYFEPVSSQNEYRQTSAIALVVVLALTLLLVALSRSVRFGDIYTSRNLARSRSSDFSSVLGLLYREKKVAGVLRFYADAWQKRISQILGANITLNEAEIYRGLLERGDVSQAEINLIQTSLSIIRDTKNHDTASVERSIQYLEGVIQS